MLLCVVIVGLGVQKGIEAANKVLMPLLILIMLILIVRALTLPGAVAGVRFYLSPDFGKLNTQSVLIALGHAFFTLSLGMGAMITYGSYVDKEQNLFISALWVTGLDTLISVMSGLAIFPAVFAEGFMPDAGPGLVFQVLPAVFQRMAFGPLWATLFFLLLFVAALASAISLLEVVTAYLVDERHWRRVTAAVTFGIAIFLLGCVCAISVGDWQRVQWLGDAIRWLFGGCRASFFDLLDNLSCNWLLPLGGLFTCLFVGWVWGTRKAVDEIRKGSANFADVHLISLLAGLKDDHSHNSPVHVITLASMWGLFIRFVSPVAVLIAFLYTIGWLELGQTSQPPPPAPAQQAEQAGGSQQ
jgi:NSS family neurotransmitter:Na+ symporter